MQNLVITDKDISTDLFQNSIIVHLDNIHYSSCTGGLECLKCEGACYFKDDMSLISRWMNDCQLIIYITKVKYGCFDIPFKKMLERMVVNLEPYYTMVDGETCHLGISQLRKKLLVIGYGNLTIDEMQLFKDMLDESTLGFSYSSVDAYFCEENELEETLRTFGGVDHHV
ncbi:MAG: flavodoxin family protein [Erysipelotrichaceae bacterium]|nr:flavodoxin family protein [Erysipelotrichaceae bacterium]